MTKEQLAQKARDDQAWSMAFTMAISRIQRYGLHIQRGIWRKYTAEELATSDRLFRRTLDREHARLLGA